MVCAPLSWNTLKTKISFFLTTKIKDNLQTQTCYNVFQKREVTNSYFKKTINDVK